ncbi:hypothetical protein [Vibrio sp. EA2]|uniref:hypothetical protein n=1 Tax=Vibrio sp. EA2 TaxID=3079860 RepID=UPI00294A9A3D|nr:hypothetical protein [Vibrio sp. EA2]MDV6250727.1 hypothetical protein [Vibrio sp. EA2]
MTINKLSSKIWTTSLAMSSLAMMFTAPALARLDGAIFTTTPDGGIVNENVRYESKEEVFLDGGPGPNAPGHAAALPAGEYYFQVTDPSGKCLLSSVPDSAGSNGGTCEGESKRKGPKTSANSFEAEPLACRRFYFDGNGGVSFVNDSYTKIQEVKIRGKIETQVIEIDCKHQLGSDYVGVDPSEMPDGQTIQLFPFANTPNPGGVYKAWVSTAKSVVEACEGTDIYVDETGENCNGFFGFIPRNSKTDNFKANLGQPTVDYQIGLRAFHDRNLNCTYDPSNGDELISNWDFGVTEPDPLEELRGIYRTISEPDTGDQIPVTFSVTERANLFWLVDQLMWFASDEASALNKPFSHFTTFADLRDYGKLHELAYSHKEFVSPLACYLDPNNLSDELVKRDALELADDGIDEDNDGIYDDDKGFVPTSFVNVPGIEVDEPILVVGFGSTGFATIEVCKSKDLNMDGAHDEGEPYVENWPMILHIPESVPLPDNITGELLDSLREVIEPKLKAAGIMEEDDFLHEVIDRTVTKNTKADGCVSFFAMLPNVKPDSYGTLAPYVVKEKTEGMHSDWKVTSETTFVEFLVESVLSYDSNGLPLIEGVVTQRSDNLSSDSPFVFHNMCTPPPVDFDTKGYWHNPNGILEITPSDISYVNGLVPYHTPSDYSGLEPFNDVGEVSEFLVGSNSDADAYFHREQLAQQLLAFILNVRHRLDGDYAAQLMFEGNWQSVQYIIDTAVSAWTNAPIDPQRAVNVQEILNDYNNNDELEVIPYDYGCPEPFPE